MSTPSSHQSGVEADLQKELEMHAALVEIARCLIKPSNSFRSVASVVLRQARSLTGSSVGCVLVQDIATGAMINMARSCPTGFPLPEQGEVLSLPRGTDGRYPGLWGHALNVLRPFYTNSPRRHRAARTGNDRYLPERNFLAVPVMIAGELLGQIALAESDRRYSSRDVEIIELLSSFFALAITRFRDLERLGLYKRAVETSKDIIAALDMDGRYLFANQAYLQLHRKTEKTLIGKHASDILGEAVYGRVQPHLERCRAGEQVEFEHGAEFGDTGRRDLLVRYDPMRDDEGRVFATVAVIRDITETRKAEAEKEKLEEQLRQAQKMEAIGKLAGGIAHDFNNILGGIAGYADLLGQLVPSDDQKLQRYVFRIGQSAYRAADLTRQLLTFARKVRAEKKRMDVHTCIARVISMLKRTLDRKIEIVAKTEASYSIILGDETQLESCLLNLAVNARDAMPSGGRLTFETTTTTLSAQKANRLRPSLPAGHYVCLKVSDTGQGVDPEIIDHIFEPFFSTKPTGEGTGLGLATSYGTIQEHGGHIRVESDAGTGTTFTILIPAHYDPTALQEDPATMPALVKGQGTVLLLDDDDTIREVAADMLRTLGYTVVSFASPVEALEWYRRKHADVDLVITDLIMPQIGGLGCFQEFKRIRPDLRAIVVSGYDRRQERERLLGEGAKAFLPKPFSIHTLSRAVAQAMRD